MKSITFKQLKINPLLWIPLWILGVTFGVHAQSPSGVSTNLKAWYKADVGATGIASVTNWSDQTTNTYHVKQTNASFQPSLAPASLAFNFNRSLTFSGQDQLEYKEGRFMSVTYRPNTVMSNGVNVTDQWRLRH